MNWKSMLISALITGIVTAVTGSILIWVQSKEPNLTYDSILSEPFVEEWLSVSDDLQNFSVYS